MLLDVERPLPIDRTPQPVDHPSQHPIAYGFEKAWQVFFRRNPAFTVREGMSVVQYPDRNLLLSGWINGEEHLIRQSALVEVPFENGKLILIGFPAQYRAQTHGTFRYLFNAIHYGSAAKTQW